MSSKLISSIVIEQSGIAFGTSGARGLVTQFTSDVCAALSSAFIHCIKQSFSFNTVALAIDNRPSSYKMAQACAAVLKQLNVHVVYYGVLPTPALAFKAMQDNIPAIMVTGSHIPFDRNGLKFYRPDGEISKVDEQAIINENIEFTAIQTLPQLEVIKAAEEEYITRYTSLFSATWLVGKRIGIYEHSSAGRDLYHKIFEQLGAEVIALGRSNKFVPIDTEAVSEDDTLKAMAWTKKHNLDMLFSTDGDGDRPLVSDEHGNWLRGDILGLLCADALGIEALAVPVSCNTAIESSNKFKFVKRTKIGSPYVIAEFSQLAESFTSVAGFEANGGFLLGSDVQLNNKPLRYLPTRDAVLPVIMLLKAVGDNTTSDLVGRLPKRFTYSDRIQNFATAKSKKLIEWGETKTAMLMSYLGFKNVEILNVDYTDGLRVTFANGNIIHLRPSGNAPELRCYGEADDFLSASELVVSILNKVKSIEIN